MRIDPIVTPDPTDLCASVDLLRLVGGYTELRRESVAGGGSWCGRCPRCGGVDRFVVRPQGDAEGRPPGWWCRRCHSKASDAIGFVMWIQDAGFAEAAAWLADRERPGALRSLSPAALAAEGIEAERRIAESREREREHRARATAHLEAAYRERELQERLRRHEEVVAALVAGGICEYAIDHFGFGYATWYGRAALTIPWRRGGKLEALQYRLLDADSGDKYRWAPGTSGSLFNLDGALAEGEDYVIVCEGAKKAAAVWSAGLFGVCAVPNNSSAPRIVGEHVEALGRLGRLYVILDPDSQRYAMDAAAKVPGARVIDLAAKVDDWLVERGCDGAALARFLRTARRVA